jgi:hypothetical protein
MLPLTEEKHKAETDILEVLSSLRSQWPQATCLFFYLFQTEKKLFLLTVNVFENLFWFFGFQPA